MMPLRTTKHFRDWLQTISAEIATDIKKAFNPSTITRRGAPTEMAQEAMKKKTRKKAAGYNSLLKSISGLARETQQLARRAAQEYSSAVDAILRSECRDRRRIESTLDGLLGFCFDPDVLVIYKKLCRHYYEIDPIATASYVQSYREMWDSE